LEVVTAKNVSAVPTALPWNFPRLRGKYRDYRGITAFPVTMSSFSVQISLVT